MMSRNPTSIFTYGTFAALSLMLFSQGEGRAQYGWFPRCRQTPVCPPVCPVEPVPSVPLDTKSPEPGKEAPPLDLTTPAPPSETGPRLAGGMTIFGDSFGSSGQSFVLVGTPRTVTGLRIINENTKGNLVVPVPSGLLGFANT